MADIKVHGVPPSTFTRTVLLACHEKGIDYELVPTMPGEIAPLNPFRKIPAITHGDLVLFESTAILRYFDRTFAGPKLWHEESVAIARCDQWVGAVCDSLVNVALRYMAARFGFLPVPAEMQQKYLDKTREVTIGRLDALGCSLAIEQRCAHKTAELAAEITSAIGEVDLLLIHGASAIVDRRDVIPAAIEAADGTIDHFGMPVDPGNLLLLGHVRGKPVLGLPGCARSPKVNGFDWVLERIVAGLPVGRREILASGMPQRGIEQDHQAGGHSAATACAATNAGSGGSAR